LIVIGRPVFRLLQVGLPPNVASARRDPATISALVRINAQQRH
jgi:hypothetical protein